MERPSTSKPRGICAYFNTPGGCVHGDSCRFTHGADERLTPYDKNKKCKFFAAGFCKREDKCWFRHETPAVALATLAADSEDGLCSICYEKPHTFGLLSECSHVFCIQCIRDWRDPAGKEDEIVESGNTKKCPFCRVPSRFITPSSTFYPNAHPKKAEVVENYRASMARVDCKYFSRSSSRNRYCPFGRECFYRHRNADGTDFLFQHGASYYMAIPRSRRTQRRNIPTNQGNDQAPMSIIDTLGIRSTINDIRTNLEVMLTADDIADFGAGMTPQQMHRLAEGLLHSLRTVLAANPATAAEAQALLTGEEAAQLRTIAGAQAQVGDPFSGDWSSWDLPSPERVGHNLATPPVGWDVNGDYWDLSASVQDRPPPPLVIQRSASPSPRPVQIADMQRRVVEIDWTTPTLPTVSLPPSRARSVSPAPAHLRPTSPVHHPVRSASASPPPPLMLNVTAMGDGLRLGTLREQDEASGQSPGSVRPASPPALAYDAFGSEGGAGGADSNGDMDTDTNPVAGATVGEDGDAGAKGARAGAGSSLGATGSSRAAHGFVTDGRGRVIWTVERGREREREGQGPAVGAVVSPLATVAADQAVDDAESSAPGPEASTAAVAWVGGGLTPASPLMGDNLSVFQSLQRVLEVAFDAGRSHSV